MTEREGKTDTDIFHHLSSLPKGPQQQGLDQLHWAEARSWELYHLLPPRSISWKLDQKQRIPRTWGLEPGILIWHVGVLSNYLTHCTTVSDQEMHANQQKIMYFLHFSTSYIGFKVFDESVHLIYI